MTELNFIICDFGNPEHCAAVVNLIEAYMLDPMGDAPALTPRQQLRLLHGLESHPSSYVLLAEADGYYAGMATCFVNFSTFSAQPYTNIHDLIVLPAFRQLGVGRALLAKVEEIALSKKHCKITLEVRDDNAAAQSLYRSSGFAETNPEMLFLSKRIGEDFFCQTV